MYVTHFQTEAILLLQVLQKLAHLKNLNHNQLYVDLNLKIKNLQFLELTIRKHLYIKLRTFTLTFEFNLCIFKCLMDCFVLTFVCEI